MKGTLDEPESIGKFAGHGKTIPKIRNQFCASRRGLSGRSRVKEVHAIMGLIVEHAAVGGEMAYVWI